MSIAVILDEIEQASVTAYAVKRQNHALNIGARGRNGCSDKKSSALATHTQGIRGELAGNILLAPQKWHAFHEEVDSAIPDYEHGTLRLDVKTVTKPGYQLPVQKDADPAMIYVLCTDWMYPQVDFKGWCYGHEAKKPENWSTLQAGRPCYAVSQDDLRPMLELFELMDKECVDA